jgi:hypothetical protein
LHIRNSDTKKSKRKKKEKNNMKKLQTLIIIAIMAIMSGCMSTHPGSSSLVYLEIKETSVPEVIKATKQVMKSQLYKLTESNDDMMVFERDATRQDATRWGNYRDDLRMRINVMIQSMGEGTVLVRADVFTVRGFASRAEALRASGRRPYKHLLDDIEKKVKE